MIFGHTHIIAYFSHIIESRHPAHAYLFFGPPRVGKSTVALWFAKSLLCFTKKAHFCDTCQSCFSFDKKNHPDFFLMGPSNESKGITIADIRLIHEKISKTALLGGYKIVCIDDAHTLLPEASHALLKILEEPPSNTIFILITPYPSLILPTIRSRSEPIRYSMVQDNDIMSALSSQFSEEQKKFIVRISTGKIGFARELTKEKIHDIINDLSCIVAVIKTAPYKKLTQNDEKLKNNAHSSLVYAAGIIRDIVLIKEGCATLTTYTFLKKELTALSLRFSYVTLLSALDYIVSMTRFLKQNVNTSLVWNNFFLLFNNKN